MRSRNWRSNYLFLYYFGCCRSFFVPVTVSYHNNQVNKNAPTTHNFIATEICNEFMVVLADTYCTCLQGNIHIFLLLLLSLNKMDYLTSAAGLPPTEMHSSSISRSSVVTIKSPWVIFGSSGGTSIVIVANLDRTPGCPINFPFHDFVFVYTSIVRLRTSTKKKQKQQKYLLNFITR